MQNDLTPFERFQLEAYGDILPLNDITDDKELEDRRDFLETDYIYKIENPEL